jgi:hypothetical protein
VLGVGDRLALRIGAALSLLGGVLIPASVVALPERAEPALGSPPRTGFQMALETGLALPFGSATDEPSDSLARRYSYQVPINIELGGKFNESFYLGTYLGLGIGAEGDDPTIENYCDDDDQDGENDISCSAVNLYIGIEARYAFAPGGNWNPWLSYGIGYEGTNQSINDHESGYSESTLSSGITYARLSGGVDYRKHSPGIGPALHLAVGRFETVRTDVSGDLAYRGAIENPAFHVWATLGLRLVIRP